MLKLIITIAILVISFSSLARTYENMLAALSHLKVQELVGEIK